jgi:hypothetical protein
MTTSELHSVTVDTTSELHSVTTDTATQWGNVVHLQSDEGATFCAGGCASPERRGSDLLRVSLRDVSVMLDGDERAAQRYSGHDERAAQRHDGHRYAVGEGCVSPERRGSDLLRKGDGYGVCQAFGNKEGSVCVTTGRRVASQSVATC